MDLPLLISDEFTRPHSNETAWVGLHFNPDDGSYLVIQRYPDLTCEPEDIHGGDNPIEALRAVNDAIRGYAAEQYVDREGNSPAPIDIDRMMRAESAAVAQAIAHAATAPDSPEL